jgi:hypothetical protein
MRRLVALLMLGALLGLGPAADRAQVQCLNGGWVDQGETCTENDGGASGGISMDAGAEAPQSTDSFMPGGSQVAPPMADDQP